MRLKVEASWRFVNELEYEELLKRYPVSVLVDDECVFHDLENGWRCSCIDYQEDPDCKHVECAQAKVRESAIQGGALEADTSKGVC
jgi:hypothetical protein